MSDILKTVAARLKKYLILMILLPIVIGGLSYFYASKAPQTYTAKTQVNLGNFQDEILTNDGALPDLLKSKEFLKGLDNENQFNIDDILADLTITMDRTSKTMTLSITGNDPSKVKTELEGFVKAFKKKSDEVYKKDTKFYRDAINELKNPNAKSDEAIKYYVLGDFNDKSNLRKSFFYDTSVTEQSMDPAKRGILGFLVGIMLDIIFLLIPEVFRR